MKTPYSLAALALSVALIGASAAAAAQANTPPPPALAPYVPPLEAKLQDWPNDRLVSFMRELADYVFEHHVVRDPGRRVYGMTYEFFKDNRQTQDFPLDSM